MTQGIFSLPGAQQGPQAQQAPGQATPFQALPAAQPKTPASEIAPYEGMDLQRLVDVFRQRPSGPLLGLITKKAEAEKRRQEQEQEQAMGAYAQQGPQTVKDIALANAIQAMRPTQTARHGGIMHGYSGGGAVAFQTGGALLPKMTGETDEQYALRMASMPQQPGETDMQYQRRIYSAASRQQDVAPLFETTPSARDRLRRVEQAIPVVETPAGRTYQQGVNEALTRASRPNTGGPAAAVPATQAPTGVGALIAEQLKRLSAGENPEIARLRALAQTSDQETAALLQRMQNLSPEEAAARAQYYKTVEGAYEPQRKSLEAAQAATGEGLLQSPEALARLASAFGGAKRVGQGLSAAAGAAGEVLGERRKRAEQLEERYQTLSSQLAITTAQAKRADVEGDEKRKRELMLQAQGLKDRLLATQADLLKTGADIRKGDISGLAGLLGAQAHMMQAGKPTDFQQRLALFRSDPKAYEAMFGSKDAQMMTRVQQVTNTDPLLKELAGKASMNLPGALEQYNARYRELIAQHAPELLLAGTGGAPGGGALSAATNIVRGGQQ